MCQNQNHLNDAIVELNCLPTGLPRIDLVVVTDDGLVVWDSETGEVSMLMPVYEPLYVNGKSL